MDINRLLVQVYFISKDDNTRNSLCEDPEENPFLLLFKVIHEVDNYVLHLNARIML